MEDLQACLISLFGFKRFLNITSFIFFKDFIYLFLERGEGRKKERERNIDQLPLACAPTRDLACNQSCALIRNPTGEFHFARRHFNQLSHSGQG